MEFGCIPFFRVGNVLVDELLAIVNDKNKLDVGSNCYEVVALGCSTV